MKTPIGIDADTGEMRLISDVERGLKCNCVCPSPSCSARLIARKGKKRAAHFAHYQSTPNNGCGESAIHLMAKHLLLCTPSLQLPSVSVSSGILRTRLVQPVQVHKEYFRQPSVFSGTRSEVWMNNGNLRPDILCTATDQNISFDLIVEIAVTHKVDEDKHRRIRDLDICAIEIDLSDLTDLEEVRFEDIEAALDQPSRKSWLHRSQELSDTHTRDVEDRVTARHMEREQTISRWEKAFVDYMTQKGFLLLPSYTLPTEIKTPYIRDLMNKEVSVSLPPVPRIERRLNISSIDAVDKAVIQINLERNGRTFPLPIRIDTPSGTASHKPYDSFLILKVDSLPNPPYVEEMLCWGRSLLMDQYERKVKKIKKDRESEVNTIIKRDVDEKLEWLSSIRRGETMPFFPNLQRMHNDYLAAKAEMESKGLTPEKCLHNTPDGWVMGCPNIYWQTLVLHAICTVNNGYVSVRFLANYLKNKYGIDTIEPARSLTFKSAALANLEYDADEIPNSFRVLSNYLKHLVYHRVLAKGRRSEYRKLGPYGVAYQTLN